MTDLVLDHARSLLALQTDSSRLQVVACDDSASSSTTVQQLVPVDASSTTMSRSSSAESLVSYAGAGH
eukprot:8444451-Karenia_brevis.AAC.1